MSRWENFKENIINDVVSECREITAKYKEVKDTGKLDKNNLNSRVDLNDNYYIFIDVDSADNENLNYFWFSVEDDCGGYSIDEQNTADISEESIRYNVNLLLESCKTELFSKSYAAEITIKVFYNTDKSDEAEIMDDIASEVKDIIDESCFTDYEYVDVLEITLTNK